MSSSSDFVDEQRVYIRDKLNEAIDNGRYALASGDGAAVLTVPRLDGTVSYFAVLRNGRTVVDHACGTLPGVMSLESLAVGLRDDLAVGRRPWTNDEPSFHDLAGPAAERPVAQASRRAALRVAREFASAYDAMADISAHECSRYLTTGELAARRRFYDPMRRAEGVSGEIVHNWPWAVPGIFDDETGAFSPGPSSRAAVAAGGAMLKNHQENGRVPVSPGLVKAMEGLRGLITDANNEWMIHEAIRTFNDLPPEWIPDTNLHDDPDEWAIAIEVGHTVCEIAEATGRRPRSLIRTFPGSWFELADNFADAVGAEFDSDEPTFAATEYCRDMVDAFERQVFEPAMSCAGVTAKEGYGGDTLVEGSNPYVRAAVLRLLVGEKGLIGFGESVAKWHVRATDLAKVELAQCGDDDVAWSVPLANRQFLTADGTPVEIRCLASARDFLDEGAEGPDAEGVEGLDHCIASYASECRRSGDVVVSIRRVDEEGRSSRLSTAHFKWNEERFKLKQHHGLGNAHPPQAAIEAVQVVGRMLDGHKARRDDQSGVFFDPGNSAALATMISAWSFALPKAARNWTPEELIAASGLAMEEPVAELSMP